MRKTTGAAPVRHGDGLLPLSGHRSFDLRADPAYVAAETVGIVIGAYVTRVIFWLAAAVAVLGAMVTGVPGGLVWLVALLAALIMVRRSWPSGTRDDSNQAGN